MYAIMPIVLNTQVMAAVGISHVKKGQTFFMIVSTQNQMKEHLTTV